MNCNILNRNSPEVQAYFKELEMLTEFIKDSFKDYTPILDGERYITDVELSELLKLSRRTLQEYRSSGKLSYYQMGGKVIYKESDIKELLEKNRIEAFNE